MRAAFLLLALGCSQKTDLLPRSSDGGSGCDGPRKIGGECAGAASAARLRYALCSCSALVLVHQLVTEAGPTMPFPPPAAVGSDQHVQIAGLAQVGGVLAAAGPYGVSFGRSADVAGTLRSGGTLATNQFLAVDGDAWVNGDLLGRVDVAGVLHLPAGDTISPSVIAESGVVNEPVSVSPPCNCNGAPDFMGDLLTRAKQNDNRDIQLSPDILDGAAQVLDLPCGDFYLSRIHMPPDARLELRVHGYTALYVGGEVTLGAGLRVTLDPMAELDLVVGGEFYAPDGLVGAPNAERVRLWLGSKTVRLGPYAIVSASVYAPDAVVLSDGDLNLAGALFAAAISVPGDVHVHYDPDILAAGASCGKMPQPPVE
jgi:hypothetical protein